MEYKDTPYFKVAHARDLTGKDKVLYRLFEILPGFLAWGTLIGLFVLSIYLPIWAAVFIIVFDLYWLFKTVHLTIYHFYNWRRMKFNIRKDWAELLSKTKHEHIYHLILLPFFNESREVIEETIKALVNSEYDKDKFLLVIAAEERAEPEFHALAEELKSKYKDSFGEVIVTIHPKDIPGEIAGKGPNITHASEEARKRILDARQIPYEDVLVSAFDIDTIVGPKYFACLTWHFLNAEYPLKSSYQPVPLYNNNIWHTNFLARVAATSSTFWQMIQQERPEKLVSFSSHTIPFKPLYEIGYWQKNMVSDDSRIYWNLFMANDGDWRTVPVSYPVSMDANLAPTFWQTLRNIYKQHRRWMWGVENIPYMLFSFCKNKKIPLKEKFHRAQVQIEGFWSLATNPLIILFLGWLPVVMGGAAFRHTILSYNVPIITRIMMTFAMLGLIMSAIISVSFLPPMPADYKYRKMRWLVSILQWIFVPFTIIFFASIPGLDAQTRLMTGKYIGKFWVTPKHRK
jgi:cellulose synthase/poly-beta-1,6-N-acetylglucosamine synthase-like glycosyltransferase